VCGRVWIGCCGLVFGKLGVKEKVSVGGRVVLYMLPACA
jgi:hypothetical protein